MSTLVFWLLGGILIGVGMYRTHINKIMYNSEEKWDLIGRASQLGLRASEHTVHTEDGYVLSIIRLHGTGVRTGPPVLLMHGLFNSAAGWLNAGNASIAVLLAAAGRDVWLGNVRGTYLSRRHAWLQPDTDALYWKFSTDEIGRLDLPAFIDYILNTTGTSKLDYIGYSQAGGAFFIMCSERPEYCDKTNLMIGLAPGTRLLHTTSIPLRLMTTYYKYTEKMLHYIGNSEVLPYGGIIQSFVMNFCGISEAATKLCMAIADISFGLNPGSITTSVFLQAIMTMPAGSSVHNMAYVGQLVNSDHVRKFDYGPEQNLLRYGTETVPVYNFSGVTVPTVVIYSKHDTLVDVRDVKWLIQNLPNVRKVYKIEDPSWNHFDFVISKNVPKFLFPKIQETLG